MRRRHRCYNKYPNNSNNFNNNPSRRINRCFRLRHIIINIRQPISSCRHQFRASQSSQTRRKHIRRVVNSNNNNNRNRYIFETFFYDSNGPKVDNYYFSFSAIYDIFFTFHSYTSNMNLLSKNYKSFVKHESFNADEKILTFLVLFQIPYDLAK